MTYSELKKQYVIEKLGKGNTVLVVDFQSMRVMNCVDMTINTINSYIAKDSTKFFLGTANE